MPDAGSDAEASEDIEPQEIIFRVALLEALRRLQTKKITFV